MKRLLELHVIKKGDLKDPEADPVEDENADEELDSNQDQLVRIESVAQ